VTAALPVTETDVVIVGAGPVGQLLALLLSRSGWRVEVLERRTRPFDLPRAVHIDHEVARVLQGVGVMAELMPVCEPMDAYEWRNGQGETLLVVQGGMGISGWPASLMFCQADLERLLARKLTENATAQVNWGWEVNQLRPHSHGCEVTGRQSDGAQATVAAKWVVACDGANSTVRTLVAAPIEDFGYSFDWVVADVMPHTETKWSPLNVQICDPSRPTTAVSGGPGRRRFEFLCLPGERLAEMARPEVIWGLLGPWGMSPANATLERQAGYTFGSRLASEWQAGPGGRVLLAGDAAHQMPPFAGQGLCSGLRDAANLAWKLDLVLSGTSGEGLMATYATERAPVARAEIELSVALGQLICVLEPEAAAERDAAMVPSARLTGPVEVPPAPSLGPGVTLLGDSHAGELGLQAVVACDGRRGLFDDLAGPRGWTLLSPLCDPLAGLAPSTADWWHSIGGTGHHVASDAAVDDVEDHYKGWFSELGAAVVLQRPDCHLFGTARYVEGAEDLVQAARAALGAPLRHS
jgi:2-polyprenyl-6-methoxyphenol hydroxylase-like FAD-dependent oxidoreductase